RITFYVLGCQPHETLLNHLLFDPKVPFFHKRRRVCRFVTKGGETPPLYVNKQTVATHVLSFRGVFAVLF
ncbi:MAG: hypothetical protein KDJ65_40835, partial [Anaerolineae bacterium]|nr:hypothetical protein [Anaerolineae bacterium]